jgi:hypothetical protein
MQIADKEIKRKARALFVFERKTLAMIAEELGRSSQTISRWKSKALADGDDWSRSRQAHLIAGEGLDVVVMHTAENFVMLGSKITEILSTFDEDAKDPVEIQKRVTMMASLADSMNKMTSAAGKLAPKISKLGVAQDVIEYLIEFVQERHPDHAEAILEVLEPFGKEIAEAYQ